MHSFSIPSSAYPSGQDTSSIRAEPRLLILGVDYLDWPTAQDEASESTKTWQKFYDIQNRCDASLDPDLLGSPAFVASADSIIEALRLLPEYFGKSFLTKISLFSGLEDADESEIVFLDVITNLSVKSAKKKLDNFIDDWYLSLPFEVRSSFVVSLDFSK